MGVGHATVFRVDIEHLLIVAARDGVEEPRFVRHIRIGGRNHGDKLAPLGVFGQDAPVGAQLEPRRIVVDVLDCVRRKWTGKLQVRVNFGFSPSSTGPPLPGTERVPQMRKEREAESENVTLNPNVSCAGQ